MLCYAQLCACKATLSLLMATFFDTHPSPPKRYELQREQRIKENEAMMLALGLASGSATLEPAEHHHPFGADCRPSSVPPSSLSLFLYPCALSSLCLFGHGCYHRCRRQLNAPPTSPSVQVHVSKRVSSFLPAQNCFLQKC